MPTVFISYTGEALDYKAPLLKSLRAVDKAATDVCRYFDKNVKKVTTYLGWEQEYFLVDEGMLLARPDLLLTGRTLMGHDSAKNQQLEDHYFGSIPKRVAAFMKELEIEAMKLGIPAKTCHNEAAPNQFELAPIYEQANIAVDHNQITMETLKKVAGRHNMYCLLNEKPFEGVNGSGKHNNWSLVTDEGENLFEPGKSVHENKQFLLMLVAVLSAVDKHAALLRESAADIGNDNRLGADEAPPAIISVYLGAQLSDVLDQLIATGTATHSIKSEHMDMGVNVLADFKKDAMDRNRTSPFAFTGNKFEFRMVGSRDSVGEVNIVLNTILAESLADICDYVEASDNADQAIHDITKKLAAEHERIVFNGNGYSSEWIQEAERRGLPNIPSMVEAIPALVSEQSIELFERFGVFSRAELESRFEIEYEFYSKRINIEAKAAIDIARKQIIPAVIDYTTKLAESINSVKCASEAADTSTQESILVQVSDNLAQAKSKLDELERILPKAYEFVESDKMAFYYHDEVIPAVKALREPIDRLEMLVDKSAWPMPSYGDLLFGLY